MVETIYKNKKNKKKFHQKRKKILRKRERESIDLFVTDNLEGIGDRDGNEVRKNLYEN